MPNVSTKPMNSIFVYKWLGHFELLDFYVFEVVFGVFIMCFRSWPSS